MKRMHTYQDTILHRLFTDLPICLSSLHWHTTHLSPKRYIALLQRLLKRKRRSNIRQPYGIFIYRDVPSEAYPIGIILHVENGYGFQIASPEKAICDELYIVSPLKNRGELEHLLFDDLRMDKEEFFRLNMTDLLETANYYHTQNHKLLQAYVRRSMKNGSNH